ncbi:PRTRC system protein E [Spirosoma sp. SC4-14]|uniref:PRTRC system protein E n=1 Tax=Spirosoma sp. SC4-14 TaxID=3128900 RepID=UPI0030D2F3F9
MKRDEFSRPYLQRTCPEGVVPEVWQAFAECADCRDSAERQQKWMNYLAIHAKYYDKQGNRLAPQSQPINSQIMNFFQQLDALDLQGDLKIVVTKNSDRLIVSVMLNNPKCGDKAANAIVPLILKGTAEELDKGFFDNIAAPMRETSSLMVNMEAHLKSVATAKEQAAMNKEKKPTETKEVAPPPPVDMKQLQFDQAMSKADELAKAKKYRDALNKLPAATDYPDKAEQIEAKRKEINGLALQGTMFDTSTVEKSTVEIA